MSSTKQKLTKVEWIQHQRDVEQQKLFIIETGKRENQEKRIRETIGTLLSLDQQQDRLAEDLAATKKTMIQLEAVLEQQKLELHILSVGSLCWSDIQAAITKMEDRRD